VEGINYILEYQNLVDCLSETMKWSRLHSSGLLCDVVFSDFLDWPIFKMGQVCCPWNLNSQQPACAAQYYKLLKTSTMQSQKPQIWQWQTCHDSWSLGQDFNSGPLGYKAEVLHSWLRIPSCTHKNVFKSHPLQLPSFVWMRWMSIIHCACGN
jgi:hypothetical protein